jgi:hypothetical protein
VKRKPYDMVVLRVTWHGDPCEVGDELVTGTGRRYQIMAIRGKRHDCMVLPADAEVQSKQWMLVWNKRNKRKG